MTRHNTSVRSDKERELIETLPEAAGPVIEAYVDGSCPHNGSDDAVAAVGCVLLGNEGQETDEMGRQIPFDERATSILADYIAVLAGLARVKDQHSTDVVVRVYNDSETVVRQLQGSYQVSADHLEGLHRETQELLNEFQEWRIEHLSEDESRHIRRADELAKSAARGDEQ